MSAGLLAEAENLLRTADATLSQGAGAGSANPNRTSCWIARRALELLVVELLGRRSVDVGSASMRSRLICLSVTWQDHPGLVVTATTAWDQLSGACHQHAYELAPAHAEARHMLRAVQAVAREAGTIDQPATSTSKVSGQMS